MTDTTKLKPITSKAIVIQSNELLRAKQDSLNLLEAKLIRLVLAQVCNDGSRADLTYNGTATELAAELGIATNNIYGQLDKLSDSIMKKLIYITDTECSKPNITKISWISYYQYFDGEIDIKLNPQLKPYIADLRAYFCKYPLQEILALPTANSIRLFELLSSWNNIKYADEPKRELVFTLDYLREFFGTGDRYDRPFDFVKRIIEPSVAAIRNNSVLPVSFEPITKHKAITGIRFKLEMDTEQAATIIARLSKGDKRK